MDASNGVFERKEQTPVFIPKAALQKTKNIDVLVYFPVVLCPWQVSGHLLTDLPEFPLPRDVFCMQFRRK